MEILERIELVKLIDTHGLKEGITAVLLVATDIKRRT
jgi:hypothetical protein